MRTVFLLEEAVREGEEAAGWYEAQREGLGREFREAFSRSPDVLREGFAPGSPWPGLLGKRGVRRLQMGRFPYHVVFVARHLGVAPCLPSRASAGVPAIGVTGRNSDGA